MVCHGQVCVAGVAAPVFRASLVSLILGSLKKASAAASCSSGYWLGPKLGPGFNSCVRASNHLSSLSLHRALAPRGRSSSIKKKIWARFYDAFGHSIVHSTAMRFDLTEHFRRLRRSAGAGPDGCRNEYRTALTAQFDDPEAAQVMRRFDQFTTLLANVDLPRWFYVAR